MKSIYLVLLLAIGCGSKNNVVNSAVVGNTSTIETSTSFIGTYDLIEQRSRNCEANIVLNAECNGIAIYTNQNTSQKYCNINRGSYLDRDIKITNTWNNNIITSVAEYTQLSKDARDPRIKIEIHDLRTTKLITNLNRLTIEKTLSNQRPQEQCLYERR